jgi:hypothetical protein
MSKVEAAGIEHSPKSPGNQSVCDQSGAQSDALGTQVAEVDLRLAAVVAAWPSLSEPTKTGILAMIYVADGAG